MNEADKYINKILTELKTKFKLNSFYSGKHICYHIDDMSRLIMTEIQAGRIPELKSQKVENPTQECLDAMAEKKKDFDDW